MEFRVLGPVQVLDGDRVIEIAGTKQRVVLAILILRANEVVGSERLIDELWGEHPPGNAAAALHNHVSRLRRALGTDVLARREWGYVLRAAPNTIDLNRFQQEISDAEPLPARERAEALRSALALWRGPAVADLATEPALREDATRLDELRVHTLERRIDADLENGRNSELIGELEGLIAAHPLREHLRWQLILSLYRAGRQAEALEVYRETRRVLVEELGLEPSPELRDLEKAILRQDPNLAATRPVPVPAEHMPHGRKLSRRLVGGLLGLALPAAGSLTAVALVRSDDPARTDGDGTLLGARHDAPGATTRARHDAPGATTREQPSPSTTLVTTPPQAPATSQPGTVTVVQSAPPPSSADTTPTKRPSRPSRAEKARPATTEGATTTKPAPTTKSPAAKTVTIADTFAGEYVDPTIWHENTTDGNVSIALNSGRLELTIGAAAQPAGAYSNIDAHIGLQCRFRGNFDARVDFTLLEWPAADNVFVGLSAIYADSTVGRQFNSQRGDEYTGWVAPYGGAVPLTDVSGSLRIARIAGVETTYFWHLGAWRKIAVGTSKGTADLALQAMWFIGGTNAPFGGQEVKVEFDNFRVTGANPTCPPGSQP